MPRAVNGTLKRRRHKRIARHCRGYIMGRKLHRVMMETRRRALNFAFRDRKARKREFRRLWVTRISAAARLNGLSYSRFIEGIKAMGIEINRKMLAELAIHDPEGFTDLAKKAAATVSKAGKEAE